MKKILLSTVILAAFSLSVILFEISCKKSATAQSNSTSTTPAQQNKIIYLLYQGDVPNTTQALYGIFEANYDGSSPQQINITMPTGVTLDDNFLSLSPDHKTIFFSGSVTASNELDIYSCNFDGSNVKKVAANGENAVAF